MPINAVTKKEAEKTSQGEKSLSDLLNEIDVSDQSLYQFSDEELDEAIAELQTSSSARSPEEIDKANSAKFESAVKSMQFCSVSSEKAILSAKEVKESDKLTKGITKKMVDSAMKASVVFAFVHGNVTTKKAWMKIHSDSKEKSTFVSFPLLNSVGSRSVLVHVYRDEISSFLEKGKKNTLVTILEKSNVKLNANRVKYLFPKGHTMLTEKKEIDAVREDLNHIFQEMAKPIDKRQFKLKWFGA
jgi:hypothetical protein